MSKPPAKPLVITFGDGTSFCSRSVEIDFCSRSVEIDYGPRDGYKPPKSPLQISLDAQCGFQCKFDPDGFETRELTIQFEPRLGWVFPKDPFVIYEPKDEQWCRALGFGKEGLVQDSVHIPRAIVTPKNNDTVEIIPVGEINYIQGGL